VLQLLPTQLTIAEIGEQLHISWNTVKAHAISARRPRRGGPARTLGLLPP
jgi:DNA-directed RNA polymerase specialized sigma24 family protein